MSFGFGGELEMTRITRVEVIDENGRSYVNWEEDNDITLSYQDDGRTLKVFVNKVKPKSPVEEAYKRVYGAYPPTTPSVSNYEDNRWSAFQNGYNSSKEDYKVGEYQPTPQKSEKEQRTKSPVEECYKDWWGQYPETGTWDSFDDKRWQGFQAGYEFAYAISTAKEVMEKVQEEQKWDAVRESVKWCEEHREESLEDYLSAPYK